MKITVLLVLAMASYASALSCRRCTQEEKDNCPALPEDCVRQRQICACCDVCRKKQNEDCYYYSATCEPGFYCTWYKDGEPVEQRSVHNWWLFEFKTFSNAGTCRERLSGVPLNSDIYELRDRRM